MSTRTKTVSAEAQEARTELRRLLPPGTTVYTVLRHVSSSGMYRAISLVIPTRDGIHNLDYLIKRADLGYKIDRNHGGLAAGGAGMDMGFGLVYGLSRSLYSKGYNCPEYKRGEMITPSETDRSHHFTGSEPYRAIGVRKATKVRCSGNDHMNYRNRAAIPYRHNDGGYALSHTWL